MSTTFPAIEPLIGQEPLGETHPGREFPPRSAVIIYGSLNYLTLGTLIAVTRGFASDIFVACDKEDSRISSLALSLGARVVVPSRERTLDVVIATYGTIVAMSGDGTQDPYMIPELIGCIADGYDAAIVSSRVASPVESVLLFNDRQPVTQAPGMIAISRHASGRLKLKTGESIGKQIADYLQNAGIVACRVGDGGGSQLFSAYRIGVVVPAYNEELLLEETVRGIPGYVSRIYVIDDCSTDRTPEVIRRLDDPRVVSMRHEVNKGVGATIIDGYRMALRDEMDFVAVMAGDNQMDPAELPKLLLPVIEGRADYTKGNRLLNRKLRAGMSAWRQLGNTILTMLNKIASGYWQISDPQNGYTVISRHALERLDLGAVYTYYGYCNDLLVKLNTFGMRVADVPMPARYGREKSKIRYSRFITRVSPMLFRSFLHRLKIKYTVLDFHPLVLFYAAGMILVPAGLLTGALSAAAVVLVASGFGVAALLGAMAMLAGIQFLFSAMALDREADCRMRAAKEADHFAYRR